MELIHLSSISESDQTIYFDRLFDSAIEKYLRVESIEILFFTKYAKNLNLHFLNESNLSRFCLFAQIDQSTLQKGDVLKEFLNILKKSIIYILKTEPNLLIKDKTLNYVAETTSKINLVRSYFDSENNVVANNYYLLKHIDPSSNKEVFSLQKFSSSGLHSEMENPTNKKMFRDPSKTNIVFLKDIITTILHWFKIENSTFDETEIKSQVISLIDRNTDQFYFRVHYYFKKLRKTPTFQIAKPKNIMDIEQKIEKKYPTKKDLYFQKKKIKATPEDVEYLSFLLASYACGWHIEFERFEIVLFHFAANKNIPHTDILSDLFILLENSFKNEFIKIPSFDYLKNTSSEARRSYSQQKIIWFLNTFDIFPSINKISNTLQKAFPSDQEYISYIRKLSPLKKPNELKKIAMQMSFIEHFIIEKHYKHLVSNLKLSIFHLHDLGASVKTLTGFYSKFCDFTLYLSLIDLKDKQLPYANSRLSHDILWFLNSLTKMLNFKGSVKLNEMQLRSLRKLFKIGCSYNIDYTSLHHLESLFKIVFDHKETGKVLEFLSDKKILSLKDVNELVSAYNLVKEQAKIEKLVGLGVLGVDDERLCYANKELKGSSLLNLLETMADDKNSLKHFNEKTPFKTSEVVINDYIVGIYDHHHYAGFSGALARGVCINSYGLERQSQLNKNFLNVVVHSKEKGIVLWGLLVGAVDIYDKTWFVLNNLQGSINDNRVDTRVLMQSVVDMMRELCVLNDEVDGVIINDAGFNALLISEFLKISIDKEENNKFFKDHKIKLLQRARLDFSFDGELYIDQNSYYGTLFPLPLN